MSSSQKKPVQRQPAEEHRGLHVLGINHKTAPVELREKLAFTPQTLPEALGSLIQLDSIEEAAILSTCNRTELYCSSTSGAHHELLHWLCEFHGLPTDDVSAHSYCHEHDATIRHAMRVACGLDSMVLGEPQITGQMKDAYASASQHGTVGVLLGKLFQHAFTVAKQVRTDTAIGSSPVSVAYAAVSLARQIFGDLDQLTALLVGAGETIELTARHLQSCQVANIIVANRSVERAHQLAEEFGGTAISLQHIAEHLHEADVVISSTASPLPILGKGTVESALKKRKHEPIFMVDLAVPRDVEAEVGTLDDVYLYSVDDLQAVIDEGLQSRQEAAEQADDIVDDQVREYLDWQLSLNVVDVITEVRQSTHSITEEALEKARRQLSSGQDPAAVLEQFAHTLKNKFLHVPSTRLREASQSDDQELIDAARKLLIDKD